MNRVVLLIILLLLCAVPIPVTALDFNAFWLYRTSGGEERDSRNEFQERYSLGVGPQLSWQPTHALTATATVGYTRTQRDSGDGMRKVDEITPSVNFGIINDLFSAQLAGSASRYSGSDIDTSASHSWDATLASRWQQPWWPNLRFNYGERDSGEPSRDLFSRTEQLQKYGSANLDWDLRLLQLDYRYNTSWDDDVSGATDTERRQHFVRAATSGRFWDNRVSYTFSYQYEDDLTQIKGRPGPGGVFDFFVPATVNTRLAMLIEDPVDPFYSAPIDGFSTVVEVLPTDYLQLQVDTDAGRPVDHLRLIFDDPAAAGLLEWDLYRRDLFSDDWVLVATGLQGVVMGDYLELATGTAGESFLLIAQNTPLVPIRLTAADAYARTTPDEGDSLTITDQRHLSSAGVQVRLTRTLELAVNTTLERQRRAEQGDDDRSTVTARLRWTPRPWITPSISYSESRFDSQDQDGEELDQLSRSYAINVATVPLPTMNLGFGVTRSEQNSDSLELNNETGRMEPVRRKGESMLYSVSATARLYPDLNTALFLSWRDNRNWTRNDEGVTQTSDKSFSARFNLNARLDRNLSADLTTSYRSSERESGDTEVADATLSIQYRPSNLLALRAFYTAYLLDSEQEDVVGGSMNLALLRTSKTRINFGYNVTYAESLTNRFSLNGSWDISRALALQSRASYTLADYDYYDVQVSLNLRL